MSPINRKSEKSLFRADLHCHSRCSDGSLSVEDLVQLAIDQGLQGLSITDHDTLAAYPKVFSCAQEKGIRVIPGVEFSCIHGQESIHVLAYSFSLQDEGIHRLCQHHHQRRGERFHKMVEKLGKRGFSLTEMDLFRANPGLNSQGSMGRPHIAQAMVAKGYVRNVQEAFKLYLGDGRSCYEPGSDVSVEETLEVIHGAMGEAILAHPHLIRHSKVLKELLQMDFDGLEAYYALFPRSKEERWIRLAKEKEWMMTGGSDFHGSAKPQISLGCSWTPEETFATLYDLFLANNPQ